MTYERGDGAEPRRAAGVAEHECSGVCGVAVDDAAAATLLLRADPGVERLPGVLAGASDDGGDGRSPLVRADRHVDAGPKPPDGGVVIGAGSDCGGIATFGSGGGGTWRRALDMPLRTGGEPGLSTPKMAAFAPASGTRSPRPLAVRCTSSRSASRVRMPAGLAAAMAFLEKPPAAAAGVPAGAPARIAGISASRQWASQFENAVSIATSLKTVRLVRYYTRPPGI